MLDRLIRLYLANTWNITDERAGHFSERILEFRAGTYWYLKMGLTVILPLVVLLSYVTDRDSPKRYAIPVVGLGFKSLDSFITYLVHE